MSYILDALKRADAERQRGAVPGLHAQQLGKPLGYASRGTSSRGWWLAGVAGVLTAAAIAYLYWGKPDVAPVSAPAVAALPAATTAPVTLPASAPQVIAPHVVQPVAEPPPEPQALPAPAVALPSPPKTKPAPPVSASPVSAAPKVKVPVSPVQSPPADIPKLSELPEDIHRQIPALAINGSVYSDNPAQRMLVVNNLVQTQGGQIAPDLRLEEIGAKSSVFSFAGTRFRIPH